MEKKLNYSFLEAEVNSMLQILNRTNISGFANAEGLLGLRQKFLSPDNKTDLEKEALENLKAKYESPKKEEKK